MIALDDVIVLRGDDETIGIDPSTGQPLWTWPDARTYAGIGGGDRALLLADDRLVLLDGHGAQVAEWPVAIGDPASDHHLAVRSDRVGLRLGPRGRRDRGGSDEPGPRARSSQPLRDVLHITFVTPGAGGPATPVGLAATGCVRSALATAIVFALLALAIVFAGPLRQFGSLAMSTTTPTVCPRSPCRCCSPGCCCRSRSP